MTSFIAYWISDAFNAATWQFGASVIAVGLTWRESVAVAALGFFIISIVVSQIIVSLYFPLLDRRRLTDRTSDRIQWSDGRHSPHPVPGHCPRSLGLLGIICCHRLSSYSGSLLVRYPDDEWSIHCALHDRRNMALLPDAPINHTIIAGD